MSSVAPPFLVNNLSSHGRTAGQQARLAAADGGGGSFSQLLNGYGKPAQPPAPDDQQLTAQPTPAPAPPAYKAEAAPKPASPGSSSSSHGDGKTETQRQESKLNNRQYRPTSAAAAEAPPTAASTATPSSKLKSGASDEEVTESAAAAATAESTAIETASTATASVSAATTPTPTADATAQAAAAAAAAAKQPAASPSLQDALMAAAQGAGKVAVDGDRQASSTTAVAINARTLASDAPVIADKVPTAASDKPAIASKAPAAASDALLAAGKVPSTAASDAFQLSSDAGQSGMAGGRGRTEQASWLERAQVKIQPNAQTAPPSTAELGARTDTTTFSTALQSALLPAQAAANGKTVGTALEGMAAALAAGTPGEFKAVATSAPPTVVSLPQPLFEAAFAPAMAARLSLLAADGVQTAQLHLNPAEMGPVAVQIVLDGQQAQVSFHAEQADTCAVLERSLPDLAAALRDAGLTLSGGGVFQQAPGQGGAADSRANNNSSTAASRARLADPDSALSALGNAPGPARATRGVLDLYA